MALSEVGVPTIVASSIICLALGAGAGALVTYYIATEPKKEQTTEQQSPEGGGAQRGGMMPKGMPGGPGGGGRGRGGRGGANSKIQLTLLVVKLDQLTNKPLAITLTDEQCSKIREQLAGLKDKEELSEEDAKKRLDALLDAVKENKQTLAAAGYRWPGEGGGRGGPPGDVPPNPFTDEENSKHLKALQERVEKE
jgi:hypothetical protein